MCKCAIWTLDRLKINSNPKYNPTQGHKNTSNNNITNNNNIIHMVLPYTKDYLGESVRTFGERLKEHLIGSFPHLWPYQYLGHHLRVDHVLIVGREPYNITKTINEAMYIRSNDPSLNGKKTGKYQFPTYRMRSYLTHQIFSLNRPIQNTKFSLHMAYTALR